MGWEVSKCPYDNRPTKTWSPGLGGEPTTAASHNTLSQGKKRFAIATFVVFLNSKEKTSHLLKRLTNPYG
jgi:hypothetical protein